MYLFFNKVELYLSSVLNCEFVNVFGQIMYKPLSDLNGIPGAKSLIICLTGYQRQDRDDIMVLISLYSCGAAFIACKANILCFLFFCIITKMLCNFTYLFADNG